MAIGAGIKVPKSLLPHEIVIPLSHENIHAITRDISESVTNLEIFGRFFHDLLRIWSNNEKVRLKITKKENIQIRDWIRLVESLNLDEYTPAVVTELNRLIQAFQELRGGMEIKDDPYESKPSPFLVSVGYLRLNRLWKHIEENDPEENREHIVAMLTKVIEYRS